jgi:glycosyltransferase involved in cell wall biosynthesis
MKPTLIYIYPSYSTFIQKDIDFLSNQYAVISPEQNWSNKKYIVFSFTSQFIFLIKNIVVSKAIIVMFAGYWSFFPALLGKLFGKPVYIILGGTDCVSFPTMNYGSLRKPLLKIFIKWSLILCKKAVPVHQSLVYCNYSYFQPEIYKHQGYKYFFPNISTLHKVIYNGFDAQFFGDEQVKKTHNSFVVIASVPDLMRYKLKGVDIVLQLAKNFPACSFSIIGMSLEVQEQLKPIPENVTIFPFMQQKDFKVFVNKHEFVLQLSVSEGFPNALCEAMLCKCIPIGSKVGAIPDIIGDTGYIIEHAEIEHVKQKIKTITELNSKERIELGEKARNRVIAEFNISKREKSFLELLNEDH